MRRTLALLVAGTTLVLAGCGPKEEETAAPVLPPTAASSGTAANPPATGARPGPVGGPTPEMFQGSKMPASMRAGYEQQGGKQERSELQRTRR